MSDWNERDAEQSTIPTDSPTSTNPVSSIPSSMQHAAGAPEASTQDAPPTSNPSSSTPSASASDTASSVPVDPRCKPDLPPRPSDTPRSPVANAVGWLMAAAGAFGATLVLQVVAMAAFGTVIALILLAHNPTAGEQELSAMLSGPLILVEQLTVFAVMVPWWRHLRPVSFLAARGNRLKNSARTVQCVVGIVLCGIGIQLVTSYALTLLLPLAPALESEYHQVMDTPVMNELTVLSFIVVAVGAPVSEELIARGVMLECSLRAVMPEASARWRDRRWRRAAGVELPPVPPVPAVRFWIANAVQALFFAVLHLNLVQGLYAFAGGLTLGWTAWRTGKLRYSIALHLVINFSSYFVTELSRVVGFAGYAPALAISGAMTVAGIWLIARSTRSAATAL